MRTLLVIPVACAVVLLGGDAGASVQATILAQTAPSVAAISSAADSSLSTSFTIPAPSSSPGDLLVARVLAAGSHPDDQALAPLGWTLLDYHLHQGIWARWTTSSEPASWTWLAQPGNGGSARWYGEIVEVTGASTIASWAGQPLCQEAGDEVCKSYQGDVVSTCWPKGCGLNLPAVPIAVTDEALVLGFWATHTWGAPLLLPTGFTGVDANLTTAATIWANEVSWP